MSQTATAIDWLKKRAEKSDDPLELYAIAAKLDELAAYEAAEQVRQKARSLEAVTA